LKGAVFVNTSVLVPVVPRLAEWPAIARPLCSAVVEIEAPRAIDQALHRKEIDASLAAAAQVAVRDMLKAFDLVEMDRAVRARSGEPAPFPLRTLDAIHLATARLWRELIEPELVFATHDARLGEAAHRSGFKVAGRSR
jgi:predicted nucleic acid-binding protein